MTVARGPMGVLAFALVFGLGGCAIDFNAAIPCDSDNDCLSSQRCDLDFARCVAGGEALRDVGEQDVATEDAAAPGDVVAADTDVADGDAAEDGTPQDGSDAEPDIPTGDDVLPDAPTDTADGDTVEPPDTAIGDGSDAETDADADVPLDGCTPAAEVCDGLDNDCDGVPDNGLDCGVCGAGAVLVESGETRFCIDTYEASRTDATSDAEGVADGAAVSRPGVVPWSSVTFDEARQACEAGGRRLCDAAEWQLACRGEGGQLYPYAGSYQSDACHGVNAPPPGVATPTGSFAECESPFGVFDQSGNVAEWTSDLVLRGGSFEEPELTLQCRSRRASAAGQAPTAAYGFRCCMDP